MIECFMVEETYDCWDGLGTRLPGAMVWRHHAPPADRPDPAPRPMPHLAVMTPAGLVCLDCPAHDPPHGHWTRTGTPPRVTVTPSLNVSRDEWHGWLVDGYLTP